MHPPPFAGSLPNALQHRQNTFMKGFSTSTHKVPRAQYLTLELRYDSNVAYSENQLKFIGDNEAGCNSLNSILTHFKPRSIKSRFELETEQRLATPNLNGGVEADFAQSGIIELIPKNPLDIEGLLRFFESLVNNDKPRAEHLPLWQVQARPIVSEPMADIPDIEPLQGYLATAPKGLGIRKAQKKFQNATGEGVKLLDIEQNWDLDHPELRRVKRIGAPLPGGSNAHGTAVLGILVGLKDERGITGICPDVDPYISTYIHRSHYSVIENIDLTINEGIKELDPGDILLLEIQGRSRRYTNNKFVAIRYWASKYSAIKKAVNKGIIVVEAAGNGGVNFDDDHYADSYLQNDKLKTIVVGAGIVPWYYNKRGENEEVHKVARSRWGWSNYGKIVNAQSWGQNVVTSGFGDVHIRDNPAKFTYRFNGTSSAAAIVAGTLACIQSYTLKNYERKLTAPELIKLIELTGKKQQPRRGTTQIENIGRQPDLYKALEYLSDRANFKDLESSAIH